MHNTYNDFEIDQGATWSQDIVLDNPDGTPIDLTGWTFIFRLAPCYESAAASLSLAIGTGITVTPLTGTINITITPTQSAALIPGKYKYELQSTYAGVKTDILAGELTVNPQVPA